MKQAPRPHMVNKPLRSSGLRPMMLPTWYYRLTATQIVRSAFGQDEQMPDVAPNSRLRLKFLFSSAVYVFENVGP
jgi:hypothetical protein